MSPTVTFVIAFILAVLVGYVTNWAWWTYGTNKGTRRCGCG